MNYGVVEPFLKPTITIGLAVVPRALGSSMEEMNAKPDNTTTETKKKQIRRKSVTLS